MRPCNEIMILALRNTVLALQQSKTYQWGHMGSCNCGFLAQQVSRLSCADIHQRAMQKYGDWNDQLNDYCPTSGLLMDDLITQMLAIGFDIDDLKHLEKLSSPKVLQHLPLAQRGLTHNIKQDVITYLKAWTHLLEEALASKIKIPREDTLLIEGSH